MRIKILMLENNISAKELAKKLGMSDASLSLRLNGKREFSLSEAKKVLKIFGKTFEEIFLT
jgi:putative transcriptional regulator